MLLILNPVQHGNALDMSRLRKEIKAPQALNLISPPLALAPDQDTDVARLRMHVAADVDDPPGAEAPQLAEEVGVAPLARGVEDDGGLIGVVLDALEELAGVGGDELAAVLAEAVEGGVLARRGDGVGGDVDARGVLEDGGQGDCEEAGAGVGVDEVLDFR